MIKHVIILVIGFALSSMSNLPSADVVSSGPPEVLTGAQARRLRKKTQLPRIDYSRFSHSTHVTQEKLSCDSCHKFPTENWNEVRKGDAAFPDVAEFPEHSTCLNCHRQQFFARQRPAPEICSNCHVNATPRDSARFLFPSLGDITGSTKERRDNGSQFTINFPHDKHADVVGATVPARDPRDRFVAVSWQQKGEPSESGEAKSCAVCHQTSQPQGDSDEEYVTKPPENLGDNFWLKKGTFKTIPNSHTVCFTCHNVDSEMAPIPPNCDGCHKIAMSETFLKSDFDPKLAATIAVTDKRIMRAWDQRISSGTFRHEAGEHPNLSCLNCHHVPTMNTLDIKSLAVPVRSCGGAEGCHVTASTDDGGILNYEIDQKKANTSFVCTKCHIGFGKESLPASHVNAVLTVKK